MRVDATQHGNQPVIMTRARINAPQAVSKMADLLAAADWADDAGIVLDWRGDFAWPKENGPMPPDLMQPLIYVGVHKFEPRLGEHLKVEVRLFVDQTFDTDDLNQEDLAYVVFSLRDTVNERVAARLEGRVYDDGHSN